MSGSIEQVVQTAQDIVARDLARRGFRTARTEDGWAVIASDEHPATGADLVADILAGEYRSVGRTKTGQATFVNHSEDSSPIE